jgi:hypothetical protein
VANEVTLLGPFQNMSDAELYQAPKSKTVSFTTGEIFGITRNTFHDGGDFEYSIEPADDQGNVCIYMKEIKLNLRLESEINIQQSIIPDSCEYNVVLEHEMRHAALAKELYGKAREDFTMHMQEFFKKVPNTLVPPSEIETYKAELDKKIIKSLESLSEKAWISIRDGSAEIDTYAEYRRVQNACK